MSSNKKGSPKSTKSRLDCYITNETNFRSQHRYITEALSICRYHNFFYHKKKNIGTFFCRRYCACYTKRKKHIYAIISRVPILYTKNADMIYLSQSVDGTY